MKILDNINSLLGDDLKATVVAGSKLKIAASCFSIYAYEALKSELSKVESFEFIFTAPTFVPTEVTDKLRKERREFFIPKLNREHSLYGSEFEIQLRNKLTQRAIARECAGQKIKEENATTASDLDIGFRVLKVDSSNMADVYYTPDAVEQDLLNHVTDNIKEDRAAEDLLFQVLLDWGVDLTLPITKETISDLEVFFVDGNALAACFIKEGQITEVFCKELAQRKPLRVVFRDAGFKDDSVKINVEQIFKLMSPHTEVKTI